MAKLKEFFRDVRMVGSNGDIVTTISVGIPQVTASKKNPKSLKVEIPIPKSEYTKGGYFYADSEAAQIIQRAAEEGIQIILRIEKQRRNPEEKDIPIEEIMNANDRNKRILNSIVGVYDINNSKWITMGKSQVDWNNDPEDIQTAVDFALAGYDNEVNVDDFFKQPVQEAPFVPKPAGFDYQNALISMYYGIRDMELRNGYDLDDSVRRKLAILFLNCADELQKVIRRSDVIDYKDYSHTRARYMMFNYEEKLKPLTRDEVAKPKKWLRENYEYNRDLLNWSVETIKV